jgi:hypothetical protein
MIMIHTSKGLTIEKYVCRAMIRNTAKPKTPARRHGRTMRRITMAFPIAVINTPSHPICQKAMPLAPVLAVPPQIPRSAPVMYGGVPESESSMLVANGFSGQRYLGNHERNAPKNGWNPAY